LSSIAKAAAVKTASKQQSLRDAGVSKDRLFVYAGGFDEWSARHMPIETGERNSGQVTSALPAAK
jgi:rhodanese-related sulfurtransferase